MSEEQMLIDIHGKTNVKPAIAAGRRYRATISKRLKLQETEADQKQEVSDLVKKLKLNPLKDGVIHFKVDGVDILITPGKESVKVTIEE